mgnify:CR=1 FL=1
MNWVKAWRKSIIKYWQLYLLLIPVIAYYIIFKYVPMAGAQIAFRNFKFNKGIWDSPWIGLKNFDRFFSSSQSITMIWNTLALGFLSIIFCFPFPIVLALLINEIKNNRFKNAVKTITYAPHFVSTIVVVGMMMAMCSPSTGVINHVMVELGIWEEPLYLMGRARYFRTMYIISAIWKDCGWNAIIFISALASIDVGLYEAAEVDGATPMQAFWKIKWPQMMPTTLYILVITTINSFQCFALIQLLTLGGPNNSTMTIMYYIYYNAFKLYDYGYGNAMGVILAIIIAILSAIQFKAGQEK